MIIAVAVNGNRVSRHFGHATHFTFFTTENKKIISQEYADAPAHSVGVIPAFVAQFGSEVVLTGEMGAGAVSALARHNIQVVCGASGDAQEAVNAFLAGILTDNGIICEDHDAHHGADHGQGNGIGNGLRQGEHDGHGQGPQDGHGRLETPGRERGLGIRNGEGLGHSQRLHRNRNIKQPIGTARRGQGCGRGRSQDYTEETGVVLGVLGQGRGAGYKKNFNSGRGLRRGLNQNI